nr:winged helix-turn-helix domain-containing protein [Streptomyces chumphonensis]
MATKKARLEATIREWITSGEYGPGTKLPSERVIEQEQEVGRTTVRLVLAKLAAEGLVELRHGSGNFVAESKETTEG